MAKKRSSRPAKLKPASRTDERTQQQRAAYARTLVLAKSLRSRFAALHPDDADRVIEFICDGAAVFVNR